MSLLLSAACLNKRAVSPFAVVQFKIWLPFVIPSIKFPMSQLPHPVLPGLQCFHTSFFFSNGLCQLCSLCDKHSNKNVSHFLYEQWENPKQEQVNARDNTAQYSQIQITQHLAANSPETAVFLSIYIEMFCSTMNCLRHMPAHTLCFSQPISIHCS